MNKENKFSFACEKEHFEYMRLRCPLCLVDRLNNILLLLSKKAGINLSPFCKKIYQIRDKKKRTHKRRKKHYSYLPFSPLADDLLTTTLGRHSDKLEEALLQSTDSRPPRFAESYLRTSRKRRKRK